MFADVILPLPPATTTYTYSIPAEMQSAIGIGFRVIVPFGTRKFYTAIVTKIHLNAPDKFEAKEIHSLIDSHPVVSAKQLSLWEWISFYYLSPLGSVCNAALPSALKLQSETIVVMNESFSGWQMLAATETKIVNFLQQHSPEKVDTVAQSLKIKNILPHIHSLIQKNAVSINESIRSNFKPKTEKMISVNPLIDEKQAFIDIGKAKKQRDCFEQIIEILSKNNIAFIGRKELLLQTKATPDILKRLIEKNILTQSSVEVSRIKSDATTRRKPHFLSAHQSDALISIKKEFEQKQVCLLHGVTSSGKTEIYIHLIEETLNRGGQVLYLVPEIALTAQLTRRIRDVFGAQTGVYHSNISDSERGEIWQKMLSDNPYGIIVGVRSSVFLPFRNLGLVVVDEEHETGYKQQDPPPRYHARDTAIVLAQMSGAKTLLGSATPSFESYYNAQTGKYGLVKLWKRFEDIELPVICLENTRELRRTKKMTSLLSPALITLMEQAMGKGEQAILFRNRRGFAPMLECKSCGWIPKCRRCDVSLTYHKLHNELKCHYCNATYAIPTACAACHKKNIEPAGLGTEQLEEETKKLFPSVAIARMDSDTMHGRHNYDRIIFDFEQKKTQVLIGTQMLSKGLDFENVSVVGIVSADSLLNHPDFRSYERGFQMMLQTSGRSGRKNNRGTVIIQTSDPALPIYRFVESSDYHGFFLAQMTERKNFHYPPFCRLISIVMRHKSEKIADKAAGIFSELLRPSMGERVLGPSKPVVGKLRLYHIREILLKIEPGVSARYVREMILEAEGGMKKNATTKYVQVDYIVDPL